METVVLQVRLCGDSGLIQVRLCRDSGLTREVVWRQWYYM